MRTHETNEYNKKFQDIFFEWFDDNIGTDCDIDHPTDETFVMTFFELTANEVSKIRNFENGKFKKITEKNGE